MNHTPFVSGSARTARTTSSGITRKLGDAIRNSLERRHDRGAALVSALTGRDTLTARGRRDELHRHGLGGQFGMLIKGAVLLAIGVFVVGAIFGAMDMQQGDPLYNASVEVENLTGQAFEIAPVVLIVLVATLILAFVRDL